MRTQNQKHALTAAGLRPANCPPVRYKVYVKGQPILRLHDLFERSLRILGACILVNQPEAARNPVNVSVNREHRLTEREKQNTTGGLRTHTRKDHQIVQSLLSRPALNKLQVGLPTFAQQLPNYRPNARRLYPRQSAAPDCRSDRRSPCLSNGLPRRKSLLQRPKCPVAVGVAGVLREYRADENIQGWPAMMPRPAIFALQERKHPPRLYSTWIVSSRRGPTRTRQILTPVSSSSRCRYRRAFSGRSSNRLAFVVSSFQPGSTS